MASSSSSSSSGAAVAALRRSTPAVLVTIRCPRRSASTTTTTEAEKKWCADAERVRWLQGEKGTVQVYIAEGFEAKYRHTMVWHLESGELGRGMKVRRVSRPQEADMVLTFEAHQLRAGQLRGVRCVYASVRSELGKSRLPELLPLRDHFVTFVGEVPEERRGELRGWWVEKELGRSCGGGIRFVEAEAEGLAQRGWAKEGHVLQKYLERPLLLRGYKFDVRVLVCVRNDGWAFVFPDGVMKFANEPFTLRHGSPETHLTNLMRPHRACPAPLPRPISKQPWFEEVMPEITSVCRRLLVRYYGVRTPCRHGHGHGHRHEHELEDEDEDEDEEQEELEPGEQPALPASVGKFTVLGMDFIMDEELGVHLIEVNSQPGMANRDARPLYRKMLTPLLLFGMYVEPASLWEEFEGSLFKVS